MYYKDLICKSNIKYPVIKTITGLLITSLVMSHLGENTEWSGVRDT